MGRIKKQKSEKELGARVLKIEVKADELIGDYILIGKDEANDRDSILIKITGEEEYILGELVITDKMKVFYNHKKRVKK
jgi:hypothetical protein